MKIKINWDSIKILYDLINTDMYTYDYEAGWIAKTRALEDKDGFVKVRSEQSCRYFIEKGFTIHKKWVSEVRNED